MSWGDIIPGTEEMLEYPNRDGFWSSYKGIQHYGSIRYRGQSLYKFRPMNIKQLKSIGWTHVHTTHTYAYMAKPVEEWSWDECPYKVEIDADHTKCFCSAATRESCSDSV